MGATGLGRDLAGAVATQLQTGLTADCTGLAIDDRRNLMQTRPPSAATSWPPFSASSAARRWPRCART